MSNTMIKASIMNKKNYFLVTFSSPSTHFAIMNTTKARMRKLINCPRKSPQAKTIGPMPSVDVCHAPPGMKNVTIGIMISLTSACTSDWQPDP